MSAVLFSAFAVEALLNHIGETRLEFWTIVERRLGWKEKLDVLALQLGLAPDFGRRPFQTVVSLFKDRDRLAHGKREPSKLIDLDKGEMADPDWLRRVESKEYAERGFSDAEEVVSILLEKAGYDPDMRHLLSEWGPDLP